MNKLRVSKTCVGLAAVLLGAVQYAYADDVLKIGVDGVMSGAAASWGLVNKYAAETTAEMYNEQGGVLIGGKKYKIEIVALDDKNDPQVSIENVEKLTSQGVKYIIGPNIDTTAQAVKPTLEREKALNFPYAFSKDLYRAPANASVLGMVASYQVGPLVYKYLMDKKGVKSISFVASNEADAKNQQTEGVAAARTLGLKVIADQDSYEPGTTDFMPIMTKIVRGKPDAIVLSGVAPADAPLLIKTARELGYKGSISTETSQDAKTLEQIAGTKANGFLSVGGASTPALESDYMKTFVADYTKHVGEWNDEAGTKVYALEVILAVLQKDPKALTDVDAFKHDMATFSMVNPLLKGKTQLEFVGQKDFGRRSQIGVPVVIDEFQNGNLVPIFVGQVQN